MVECEGLVCELCIKLLMVEDVLVCVCVCTCMCISVCVYVHVYKCVCVRACV